MIDMISINMKCESVKIALKRIPSQKHILVNIKKTNLRFDKDLKSYQIHATISIISVCYKNGIEKSVVFKSVDNTLSEIKLKMIVPFHSYSNWFASLDVSKNNYTINMKSLFQIIADISHLPFSESLINNTKIMNFLKRRNFLFISQINSSELKIVGSKSTRAIEYAFDKFSFSIDTKTLDGSLNLHNSWISLITTHATKVSSDFSIIGTLKEKKLCINIPLFSCTIPFEYIVVIQDFIDIFLQYQYLIKVDSFPKIDIKFLLDMKGIDINLNQPKHMNQKNLQIRKIKLKYKNSILNFKLSSIKMGKLLSLRNFKAYYDQKSLNLNLEYIRARVIDLIQLFPKNAFEIIQKQNTTLVTNDKSEELFNSDSDSETTEEASKDVLEMKKEKSIELPKLKISGFVETVKLDLKLTNDADIKFHIKDIKADINNNIITASAMLEKIKIHHQIISKQIQYQFEIIVDEIIEIMIKADNWDINIDKNIICMLLSLHCNTQKFVLPSNFGMKISFILNQIIISNNFKMTNLKADIIIQNSKIIGTLGMDSINLSFIKFKTKELVKLNADIIEKSVNLSINLNKITIYVIALIDLISKLPLDLPTCKPLNINLNVTITPIKINLCFAEDILNIIFNSPVMINVNTFNRILHYASLMMKSFQVNLNNNEIVSLESFKFVFDKNIDIEIPSIKVAFSMISIYKLVKMFSIVFQNSFISMMTQKKVTIYNDIIDKITCKVPKIQLLMQQTKSKRNVSLNFENTEFNIKNSNEKAVLFGKTKGKFTASDGFLSFDITHSFNIIAYGELSEIEKNCSFEVQDQIIFEITTFTINQILKNLTATEDEAQKQYSICNETGTDISIIINIIEYELKSKQFLPNITNFAELDIKLKIGKITHPFQLYSTYSKISTPLYFGENFILVWMDTKKLQLRLLSPILFKNKSSIDLNIQVNNKSFILYNNSVYCLEYTIQKVDSIIVKYNGDQQSVSLNDSSMIKLEKKFIIVSKKRKFDTLRTTISFYVHYYFRNEMTSNIMISIKGEKKNADEHVIIKPYKVVPIPFFLPSLEILSFDIAEIKDFKGIHVVLKLKDIKNDRYFVSTKDKKGKEFILQFSLSTNRMNIISISPFLIYYNSLSIPLIFSLTNEEKFICEKILDLQNDSPSEFFTAQKSNNIWKVDDPIMFSPFIKTDKTKKIKIYITSIYSTDWSPDPIIINNFDSGSDIQIPLNNDIVSLARFYVYCSSNLQPNTFIFFISPKYAIINQTSEIFSIDLFNGKPIEIPPNSTIPVTFIRKSLKFSVAIVKKLKKRKQNLFYSNPIDIVKISSLYISVVNADSPVLFQISVEKDIHYITMMLNRSLPYLFINKTDFKVSFFQKETNDLAHEVISNESLPFYLYDENMPSIIQCNINNEIDIEIDINRPSFPIKIGCTKKSNDSNLYYYVDLSSNKGSIVTLMSCSNDKISIPINKKMNSNESFSSQLDYDLFQKESLISILINDIQRLKNKKINFNLNFTHISIMIITEKYQELCNITLKNIFVNTFIHDFEANTQVAIGLIKVDDQNKYAVYQSVFQILPFDDCPAALFKINSFGSHKYGKIEIKLRPINFQIDLSFISDLIGEIFYFEDDNSITNDSENSYCMDSNESNNESSDENSAANHIKFKMNGLPFTEIMHNIMSKQTKYHINKIIIQPFIIHTTFHTTTSRTYHQLQTNYKINNFVNFIPSFNNVTISIDDSHSFMNLSGTTDEIVFNISNEIKQMIHKQLSIKNSIIGTKKMIIDTTKSLFKPANTTNGIINKTNLCLSVCESTLCYFSSILNLYTNDQPIIRTDSTSFEAFSWGVSSLTSSLKEGAFKLVNEPYKRGTVNGKNYICRYITGTAIGLTKCAAKMTSGIYTFGASLFSCVKRFFFHEKILFIDKRECDPILGMHSSENDHLLWYTGCLSSGLIEVYAHSIFLANGNIFIKNFVDAEIDKNEVVIYDVHHNSLKNIFDDENQAIAFYSIVESQLLRRKILESNEEKTIDQYI